jgi:arylsulfatase A-like enzyme
MPGRVANVRPGLIIGPGDPTGRFTHWPHRMAEGGEVLCPGDGSTPTQYIDGRDLGAWIVKVIEDGAVGVFNALGPERRFAYEEGIRSPFVVRYPRKVKAGSRRRELVICQDLAPTLIELAGGKPGSQIQGRSLLPLFAARRAPWRKSILIEYWAEQAMPWLVGMTYKAVRTDRYKYIHWVNRGKTGELDELYDLERDPFEIENLNRSRKAQPVRDRLRRDLKRLVAEAVGL